MFHEDGLGGEVSVDDGVAAYYPCSSSTARIAFRAKASLAVRPMNRHRPGFLCMEQRDLPL